QALVKQTQATLDQAQIDLDHTLIRAPVDGTVIARRMDVGQTVAASFQAPTIFDIAQDLTKMQVDASVDEADIGQVHPGQAVVFNVDAYPGVTLHGTVSQIRQSPLKVQNVITYDVVVSVASEGPKLFPGMTANVRIALGRADDVLKIPNLALRFRPAGVKAGSAGGDSRRSEGQTVWVLGSDRKLKPVAVKVGLTDGAYTQMIAGDLHAGDQIAVGNAPGTKAATPPPMPGRGPRI
ncbi:MAG TPA: efflux RND transporter periplasmic adaptor subunit, partial [Bryobacteraceae bacterium]|nr:efflux RND transporter periplasmic adaptor subunit [Bryobacteraceae bacterium]